MSKFGDKFLDMMHLNNDYEDDYEDDYNEDDYEDDDRPARSYSSAAISSSIVSHSFCSI